MAATGNEVPLLSQLKKFKDWLISQLSGKLDYPEQIPHPGDVVMYQTPGTGMGPVIWTDPTISIPSATTTSNGLMNRTDKQKLDGLPDVAMSVWAFDNVTYSESDSLKTLAFSAPIDIYGTGVLKVRKRDIIIARNASGSSYPSGTAVVICSDLESDVSVNPGETVRMSGPLTKNLVSVVYRPPSVDVVKASAHSEDYTKDTLEFVVDGTGKVTEASFINA